MPSPVSPERVRLPGRYRVVRHLRSGGMASLWQAHDDVLDRDVAVKVLAEHLTEDPAARERFGREARAVARLSSHPHVVTIYDVGECDGCAFIVMELMAGGSLADRLSRDRPVARETALRWLEDAASALDDAHAAGIVHRDIKPGNMLLDDRGRLALADFGIARVARERQLTRSGEILGTLAYIAPEQALGKPATAASDTYSLAVVAYELLAGRRPFDASHPAAQARAHVEDEPPPVGPLGVDAVLRRGLAKAPAERWGSAGTMVDALERVAASGETSAVTVRRPLPAGSPTQAARAPRIPKPIPSERRPGRSLVPWVTGAALAIVAGLVLAAALGGSGGGDTADGTGGAQATASAKRSQPARSTAPTAAARTTSPATSATTRTTTPPAAAGDLASAGALQVAGYRARLGGRLDEALALDQRVLAACGDGRALDPCGYALFEMGAVLRRLGRGQEAAGYLQRRLTEYGDSAAGEVRRELALAAAPAHGPGHGKKARKPRHEGRP